MRSWGLICCVLTGVAACRAQVPQLAVVPRRPCPGTATSVTWDFHGNGTLLSSPAIGGLGVVTSHGVRQVVLTEPTLFTLIVTHALQKRDVLERDVIPIPVSQEQAMSAIVALRGSDSIVATDTIRSIEWDPRARITGLSNRSGRAVIVRHNDRFARLPADTAVQPVLVGDSLHGRWEFSALRSLSASTAGGSIPRRLSVVATIVCRGEP